MPTVLLMLILLTGGPEESAGSAGCVALSDTTTDPVFEELMAHAREHGIHQEPFGHIIRKVGQRFLGSPYAEGLLDKSDHESLVLDLTRFDCVLYVEVVLALATGIALQDYSYATFARNVESLRYRGGKEDGYCSRLHYFSEWIADNEARGAVSNVTRRLGGEPLDKQLTFMSEHRESYPRFATHDSLFGGIQSMERALANLEIFHIPQNAIAAAYVGLQDGDIVATSTYIEGLDVSHTGFVVRLDNDSVGLLHASTDGGVKVSRDLQRYVKDNKIQIGIVVARPVDPRGER